MNVLLKCCAAALLGTVVAVLLLSTLDKQTLGRDYRDAHYESLLSELQLLRKETRSLKARLVAVEKLAERHDDQLLAGSTTLGLELAGSPALAARAAQSAVTEGTSPK